MIKITTLVDNHALEAKGLEAEHGFSCFVETASAHILFDTGKSGAFIKNARELGVDLSSTDLLVISHAHYDHSGGVRALLEQYAFDALDMWTGKGFEHAKYADDPDGLRYLGYDFDRALLDSHHVSWHSMCNDTVMVRPGIWLLSSFDRIHPMEQPNPRFLVDRGLGPKAIDDFSDEVALVLDSPKGMVMITGCSHPGILNMIDSVSTRFAKPLYALFGGIHLFDASPERRDLVIQGLIERAIPMLGVSHCTGDQAEAVLDSRYPGYFANMAGVVTVI